KSSTLRYLSVLRDNLDHMQGEMDGWQSDLENINARLVQNQHDIIRFSTDNSLNEVPDNEELRMAYFEQGAKVRALWMKTDSANRKALFKLNLLQNKVANTYTTVLDESDQIDSKIKIFAIRAESGEFDYIWKKNNQYSDLNTALKNTTRVNQILFSFFIKNDTTTHLVSLVFLLIMVVWVNYVRLRTLHNSEKTETLLSHANYILKRPVIASLLIPLAIAPYFYDHPPVIFLESAFLVSLVLVLILVKSHFSRSLFNFLFILFWITILYALSNLLLQITNADRYITFILSLVSLVVAIIFLSRTNIDKERHLPYTGLALRIFIVMQFLALILNISGRFSLAKIAGITAVFNLWMAISLYFVVQIIVQAVYLQLHTKQAEHSFVSLVDYSVMQKKFKNTLNTFAFLLWLFFLLQNLNIDDWVHDYLSDLLSQSRTIGGASFTFGGFVIFIIVIWLSSILSRLISYFYDIAGQHASDISVLKKKNRASTLLIRIGVFTVGFLLAVAASGFPIDKLTIIFSAFGVGIGFGLQNVVNNLVSGMILAFEKPIQIGDTIEVNSRTGTIKEIGIRSSKLATYEGAEVIIPNGDLISQQVVNWTLSNSNRRAELIVGTAYGSDIQKVKSLLKDILSKRTDIMPSPGPAVFLHNLNESSVDFRVLFWVADLSNFLELKSSVLGDIYDAFNKEGIEIPFPQRDVNLHFKDEIPAIGSASRSVKKGTNKTSPDQES
ncbi:MAG TPA: mechanosensitive ion channel domain-containing protein, partial [Mucilaginibacter sp.]|nr:mechanosensitive ion channel domain-containing protein [Mucilaginibacter sp.]